MADWNRYRRQEQRNDYDRGYRRDRQPEQFQTDRSYADDQGQGYGQMGDDQSQARFGNQYDETGYQDDRYGSSERSGGRNRERSWNNDQADYGTARVNNRERAGFGSFTSDGFRNGGDVGPREHPGYGRGESFNRAYSGGSYGAGTYGVAPRRDYGDRGSDTNGDRGFFERAGDEVASWFGDDDAARRREMDHSGRGPANYTRSDERILEDTCDKLTQDWGVDARNVQVTVAGGEVTLDGTVENRRQKRRAEDVVHDVSGVGHVQNNLRTQDTTRSQDTSANQDTTDRNAERNTGTLS